MIEKQVTIKINAVLYRKIKALAANQGLSVKALIEMLLKELVVFESLYTDIKEDYGEAEGYRSPALKNRVVDADKTFEKYIESLKEATI